MKHKNNENTYYRLWWKDKTRLRPAGVAFFNEKYHEYALKIDFFPESKIFLRSAFSADKKVIYRAEILKKDQEGNIKRRDMVGNGIFDMENPHIIKVKLYALDKELILSFRSLGKNINENESTEQGVA